MRLILVLSVMVLSAFVLSCAFARDKQKPVVPELKLNYAAMDKLGWKLSCQAYTFGRNGLTCFETIDILHKLGVRYIELYPGQKLSPTDNIHVGPDMSPAETRLLLDKLKQANITAVNFGVVNGLDKNEAAARKVFDFAKAMGLQTIVTEPQKNFAMLDKLANEYGINVAFHNHPRPSYYWNPDTVLKNSKGRSDRLGSCADTGHWYRSGFVPLDCLKKLQGHIISLHFKDLNEKKHDMPWGAGVCNARGMLEEIKRQGIHPVFSIEYESGSGNELIANVAKCCQYFSDTATELTGQ